MTARIFLLGFLLANSVCVAQPDFRFHQYSLAQGLPSPGIRDIVEDPSGLLWIGTNNGLTSFDGYQFKVYRKSANSNSELASNDITALLPLENGDLLAGTSAGLHLFDVRKQTFINYWDSLPPAYISQIIPATDHGYWIGSSSGLYHLDKVGNVPKPYFKDASSALFNTGIFSIHLDKEGQLWITTSRKGFFKLNTNTNELTNYRHDPNKVNSLSSDIMRQMIALDDGRLVLGTADAGYNVFDPRTDKFTRHNHDPADQTSLSSTAAFSLLIDSQENLWIGTWANGLNLINTQTWKGRYFKNSPDNHYSIGSNSVTTIFESSNGDIWFGSSASGLSRLTPQEQKFSRYRHDSQKENTLVTNYVRSVYEDAQGIVWFGTNQGGLNRYDPTTDTYTVYLQPDQSRDKLSRGTIWSISEGKNDHLWLATSRGVADFDKNTGKVVFIAYEDDKEDPKKLSGNNILKVLDDHEGNLWVGIYYGGLNRVDLATGNITKYRSDPKDETSLSGDNVFDILIDKQQRIWVGTDEGLNLFAKGSGKFTRYLTGVSVFHLNEGDHGEIYVASDRGLVIFNPDTQQTSTLGEAEGLNADHVNSVLTDDAGFLWLSSNNGIDRYDPVNKKFIHIDETNGLVADDSESKSCFKSKSGRFYFGGTNGATAFDPLTIIEERPAPRIRFTDFSLFNKVVPVNDSSLLRKSISTVDTVLLGYTDYIFALEFAAVEFALPMKIKYAYKLDGFDKDWIFTDAKDRKAVYTNVPHGTYILKVKASDIYEEFGDESRSLTIIILPPWWKTWWAKVLFYGTGLMALVIAYRLRVAFIERQNKILEQQVVARTAEVNRQRMELQEQAAALQKANLQKSKLFSIIAHDLKSPLNSLKSLLMIIDPGILTSSDLERMKNQIGERVEVISGAMENLLGWAYGQMELETVKLERIDVGAVAGEMMELYRPIAEKKKVTMICNVPLEQLAVADLNLLRAVLRNLTSNAIKFTSPGGRVLLSSRETEKELIISVSDSGVGMDDIQVKRIFSPEKKSTLGTEGERGVGLGLQVVYDFVIKMKGQIWVESKPGEGTTFSFSLPRSGS